MGKEYYLGLDMGTSSVGWAVTDPNYNLLRAKGKDLWGVRLFKEANTSAERRAFRTSRRRLQRERARIGFLKELFAQEIDKIDPGFFQRLEDSKFYIDDKKEHQPFTLFAGEKYSDKEYYKEFPTIFHLRKELIENKNSHDVRLVYLAVSNMFKHRGHFLNSNLNDNEIGSFDESCNMLVKALEEYYGYTIDSVKLSSVLELFLSSKKYSNSKKKELIITELDISKKEKQIIEVISMICGLKGKMSILFPELDSDSELSKMTLSFRDNNYEEKEADLINGLTEEQLDVFLSMKSIHDNGILTSIMKGKEKTYEYLSYARVDSYDKHNKDLHILKELFLKNAPELYDDVFRKMENNSYSAYVGSVNSKIEKTRRGAKAKEEDFFGTIKKIVDKMPDSEEKNYVISEIENGNFLPKQLTSQNGVIPYQVHLIELRAILANAEVYLPFLAEVDESGLSNTQKIIQLFSFQIPYYIGPLVNNKTGNAWVVRKEMGKVFPWNFDKKVNQKASQEEFIKRMVNHCTYLCGEKVLPKNSLMYEKFMVLNELNNLKINGELISVELKQRIFDEIFINGKKVKKEAIVKWLKTNGIIDAIDNPAITGIDGDFTNTLANYSKFCKIFNTNKLTYKQEKIAEEIIYYSTIYGDSKKFLKELINEKFGDELTKEQRKIITGIKFRDWGRLSKKLLELGGADVETREISTIISRMWNTNNNFMELMSDKFTYRKNIEEMSTNIEKTLFDIEYDDLLDLYISTPVRRMVWQTILIMKELYKVLGCAPKKIFVEMARDGKPEKVRTLSRKKKFEDLYKKCKDEIHLYQKIKDTQEASFKSKKLYLYYTQKGRCMYTGEIINLDDLYNDNLYDIDHIYPRHFVKDDSLENNLVLVKQQENRTKDGVYPIKSSIREARKSFWKTLVDGGFITEEKFKRLIRNYTFTEEERAAFVNRQLVETRQGTKVITKLLEKTSPDSEVVYVKAGNVSDFRHKFNLLKCRNINDFHHANDAYLNIVVGNVYDVKFTKNPMRFIKDYDAAPDKNKYHMDKVFNFKVERCGVVAWNVDSDKSIDIVRRIMNKQTPLVTYMNYEEHGGFADQTIYSAKEAQKAKGIGYISIKSSDDRLLQVERYGGFKKFKGAFFFLVEHSVKGKRIRSLEAVPIYKEKQLRTKEQLEKYCVDNFDYVEPVVKLNRIKMYSLIKVNGFYLYLTGRSGEKLLVNNAVQLSLDKNETEYIRLLSNNEKVELLDKEMNLKLYDSLNCKHCEKIYSKRPNAVGDKLIIYREKFINLDISEQAYVLNQLLLLSGNTNNGADLQKIGGAKSAGVMTLNKKISDNDEFILINQSTTGLYEEYVDLLRV